MSVSLFPFLGILGFIGIAVLLTVGVYLAVQLFSKEEGAGPSPRQDLQLTDHQPGPGSTTPTAPEKENEE